MAKRLESRKRKHPGTSKPSKPEKQIETYRDLEAFDRNISADESECLAGIDEAGRGALAGPVVAAAVVLPCGSNLLGVNDSKTLTEADRERLFAVVVDKALAVGISFSHPQLIDRINILNATLVAMASSARRLKVKPSVVLLDGRDRISASELDIPTRVIPVVGGDRKSLVVAAASIIAKVARDRLMRKLHKRHPAYNFLSNKGYGTKEHIEAIRKNGMAVVHRRSYHVNWLDKKPSLF